MANNNSPFITTGERVRSFIGWAFAISILVHFIVMPLFPRLNQHHEEQEVEKVSVTKKIVVKVPTPPPPTPTPPPPTPPPKSTPPPKKQQQQPQPKLKLNIPKTTSNSNTSSSTTKYVAPKQGSDVGAPSGQGTGPPAPPAPTAPPGTPKPACKTPYQDATVVQQAQPEYPDSAREQGLGEVQVAVKVTIGPSGSLVNAAISQSAGNMALDQAALAAARQSTYAPKIVNCEPVTGDYLFRVTFDPNS
jgi:protein TonB